jgi:hypothetical protein
VTIGGFEVLVQDYEIESNESMVISLYLPEETPRGAQRIAFFFDNAEFEEVFYVVEPPEFPITTVVVVVLVTVGGFVGGRLTSRSQRGKEGREGEDSEGEDGDDEPGWRPPNVEVEVGIDPGTVSLELDEPSLTMDTNLWFDANADEGDQRVELDGDSLILKE